MHRITSLFTSLRSLVLMAAALSLSGCFFNESGTEYQQPSADTEPRVMLNYDYSRALNSYLTFEENSADISVTFGSQTFRFPERSEMRLPGFGGFETDRVWKTSVIEDSRGIKTLRLGYYLVTPNTSDINAPVFHNFATDSRGNVYLTETYETLESDLGKSPLIQPRGALLSPAEIAVGDSWVAGPTLIPWFYDFSPGGGWTVTLLDDNATAPVSGIENCILLKYYKRGPAFYLYLKNDLGIVEWINNWEEDADGNVLPIDGWALNNDGDLSSDVSYTGWGWGYDQRNPIGGLFESVGLKVVAGEEANASSDESSVVNNSGYDFTRVVYTSDPDSTNYPSLLDLRVPDERDTQTVDFTDSEWDALAGEFYRPLVRVSINGNTYRADESTGTFSIQKMYDQKVGPSRLMFMGQGTLINEDDSSDSIEFVGQMEGTYLNADADGLSSDFAVFGLDENNRLPTATAGSTYRIYIGYAQLNEPLRELMELDSDSISTYGLTDMGYTSHCYGNRDADELCDALSVSFEIEVPDIEGELGFYVGGRDAEGSIKSASQLFYLPVTRSPSGNRLTARLYDSHTDAIRGSLNDDNEFNTGYLNALSSAAEGSNIVKYSFDMGDGTVLEDSSPLGTYSYSANGEYLMTLTVTDNLGRTDSTTRKVFIRDTGTVIVRNIADDFSSGYFMIGIENLDEPDGYYDAYDWVSLSKNEEKTYELEGDINYLIEIKKNGVLVQSEEFYLGKATEEVIEVDLDD